VHWAQDYALANRELMMRNLIAAVQGSGEVPAFEANVEVVSCHHNYVTWEHHYGENVLITRKGAVRARVSNSPFAGMRQPRPTRWSRSAKRGSPRSGSKSGCTFTNCSMFDRSL
jgi:RNA-splicing ligase RtcB